MAGKGKPEVLGARYARAYFNRKSTSRSKGAHYVSHATRRQKTGENQTAPPSQSAGAPRTGSPPGTARRPGPGAGSPGPGHPPQPGDRDRRPLTKSTEAVGQDRWDDVPSSVCLSHPHRIMPGAGLGQESPLTFAWRSTQTLLAQATATLGAGGVDPALASRRQ